MAIFQNPLSPISSVSGVSTVDDMIAAGALDGTITIFQLPRVANVQGIHPPSKEFHFNSK